MPSHSFSFFNNSSCLTFFSLTESNFYGPQNEAVLHFRAPKLSEPRKVRILLKKKNVHIAVQDWTSSSCNFSLQSGVWLKPRESGGSGWTSLRRCSVFVLLTPEIPSTADESPTKAAELTEIPALFSVRTFLFNLCRFVSLSLFGLFVCFIIKLFSFVFVHFVFLSFCLKLFLATYFCKLAICWRNYETHKLHSKFCWVFNLYKPRP